jgi:hypothetical protein
MKAPGFSFTYVFGWIATLVAVAIISAIFLAEAGKPAIVMAAEVLSLAAISLLIIVPVVLLSMLRSANLLQQLADRRGRRS